MGRPRKKPLYVIVGSELAYISKERILEFDSDPDEPLMDELERAVADEVLIALRKATANDPGHHG